MARIYQWKRLNFGDKPAPDIAAGANNTLAKLLKIDPQKLLNNSVNMSMSMTLEGLKKMKKEAIESQTI